MSIFRSIMSKIFGGAKAKEAPSSGAQQQQFNPGSQAQQGGATTADSRGAHPVVDVEEVLRNMAAQNSQKFNWRESIVDLMKLLGLDSSLTARKELAQELNYPGNMEDSATMNIWLHKQVMQKLAQNGGKVPQELLN
jgi:hypothetical protein